MKFTRTVNFFLSSFFLALSAIIIKREVVEGKGVELSLLSSSKLDQEDKYGFITNLKQWKIKLIIFCRCFYIIKYVFDKFKFRSRKYLCHLIVAPLNVIGRNAIKIV